MSETRGRILLIDDDLSLGAYLARVLRTHGQFEVTHELDAAAALRCLEAERWDLLITDIEMPGMTGLELVSQARRLAPDLPIAVVTGHATLERAVTALRRSVSEFLQKPIAAEDLISRATALVEASRKSRAASREVVLAIGAHPGDVEIGAGGALLAHRAADDSVAMLVLSGEDRRVQQSADLIGARLFTGDLAEAQIPEGDPTIGVLREVLGEVRPTVVYCHSVHDVSADHRNAHRATTAAVRHAEAVGQVYCYQAPSATIDFRPAHFVAVDRHIGVKLRTTDIFGGRAAAPDHLDQEIIESTARYWSRFGGGSHAEAFEVVRHRASQPVRRAEERAAAWSRTGR